MFIRVYEEVSGRLVGVSQQNADGSTTFGGPGSSLWNLFLEWNAKQPTPLDLSDKVPDPPTPTAARDSKLMTPRVTAALFLLYRDLRGGAKAPAWALNLANDVLTAIDAAGNS